LPREELARAPDARLDLVEDEHRARLVGELPGLGQGRGGERPHASLALDGLEHDRGRVGPDRVRERLRGREADARDERLERRPLRRLPGDRERAHRAAVEGALERDELRLPGRLARPLERGLDRLRAGVAEERVRAAEAVGQALGEVLHRLGRVQVRHVPEALELRPRRRERPRVAVAEADDGDAGEQVEVALAVVGDEPRALAVHERDREARVCREQRRAGEDAHATTAVAPMVAATPPRAAVTAAWSFGTIPPCSVPPSSSSLASSAPISSTTSPPRMRPSTSVRKRSRSAPSPSASAAAASSALTFSGPSASGATTGVRPAASACSISAGAAGTGSPTKPSSTIRSAGSPSSSPKSGSARGPIAAQSAAFTSASASRTTSSPAAVVTRRPATNSTGIARRAISAEICGPAP